MIPDRVFVVSPYRNLFRYNRLCSNCIMYMKTCGVKDVVYSTGYSNVPYLIENIKDMELLQKSRGDL